MAKDELPTAPIGSIANLQHDLNKIINAMHHIKKARNFNGMYGAVCELNFFADFLTQDSASLINRLEINNPKAYEEFKERMAEEYRKQDERKKHSKAA